MKKVVLSFLIVAHLFVSAPTFAQEKLISITTGEYPPWSSSKYKHGGFIHHLISEVFRRQGYQVNYIYHIWARNYKEGKSGKHHATAFWYYSEERAKYFYYSDALYSEKIVFFHLKSLHFSEWETLDDLLGFTIGATRGYTYTKAFWDAHASKKLNIVPSNSDTLNFRMLLKKRTDIFIMDLVAGKSLLSQEFDSVQVQQITHNPIPLATRTGHLLFPKVRSDSLELLKQFNQGLASMKKDGTYDELYNMLLKGDYTKP